MKKTEALVAAFIAASCLVGGWWAVAVNSHAIVPLIAFAINLSISMFVFLQNNKNKLYRTFALWNLVLAGDNLLLYGLYLAQTPEQARIWTQITGFGYYFLPATSYHFVLVFTKSKNRIKKWILAGSYLIATVFTVLALLPPFYNEYVKETGVKYYPEGTPLYTASMIVLLIMCTLGMLHVLNAFLKTKKARERNQYGFLLFAGVIALVIGSVNYALTYGITVYPISSIAFAIYGIILAYAILKHQFMDIEVIVRKSVSYSILTALVVGGYAAVMLVANSIFHMASPIASIPLNAVVIFISAIILQPLRDCIQNFVDRMFFREKYDYRKALMVFSDNILKTIGLQQLSLQLVDTVSDTMKIEKVSLVLRNNKKSGFETVSSKQYGEHSRFYEPGSGSEEDYGLIASHLESGENMILAEELKFSCEEKTCEETELNLLRELEEKKNELVLPLKTKAGLKGFFLTASKLSEESFTSEDIELLKIVLNQTATAIENSELYDQTLEIKRYYDDIVKSMTSGMITFDLLGNIVTVNAAADKLLDIDSESLVGRRIDSIANISHQFSGIVLKALSENVEAGSTIYEIEFIDKNKEENQLALTVSPLWNRRSEKIGAVALFNDITEKKELERQLERSKRLAYLGELAANIAHEIKNPMGAIKLFVETLAEDFDNPVARKNFKEIIPQEVENVDRMIRELLLLARPSSLIKIEMDIIEIVRLTCRICEKTASAKGVKLETNFPVGPVEALVDSEKFKQAVHNIILNALEAVATPEGVVRVAIEKAGSRAFVKISDNGPGIPENERDRIFLPFVTTKGSGTGLGLAIANKIIEDHGAKIELFTSPEGTCFSIIVKSAP